MATMSLTGLPNELLDEIIQYVLPEGFAAMKLTCRRICILCERYIERHEKLLLDFQAFSYPSTLGRSFSEPFTIVRTAWDLLVRIAMEPVIARYIRNADFANDSYCGENRDRDMLEDVTDPRCGEAVTKLLASSRHLKQARLDWKKFHGEIEGDLKQRRYSQNAAVFLLTLLPNVHTLELPINWTRNDATDKLLNVIVREAKTNDSHPPWNRLTLSQVTIFNTAYEFYSRSQHGLDEVVPFLALPHMREFNESGSVAIGDSPMAIAHEVPYRDYLNSPTFLAQV